MADWYVSSAAWTAIPQFAASHAYSVGDIVRPLTAPALGKAHVFRCTTAGTSSTEPTWPTANNGTITTGGATFTNVTGQSTYNWNAPAGDLYSISQAAGWNRPVVGDRVFLSSDHSESAAGVGSMTYGFNGGVAGFGCIQVLSVNRAGSVPPVAADLTSGAAITCAATSNQALILEPYCNMFWQGITFTISGTTTSATIRFSGTAAHSHYFKNCALVLGATSSPSNIGHTGGKVVFDNTTVQFSSVGQYLGCGVAGNFELTWINTPAAIQGAIIPTNLFNANGTTQPSMITCRGVDLSAVTGTLAAIQANSTSTMKVLLDSCKIASGVTRMATPIGSNSAADEIELVNCYDGTNVINERHTAAGDITTERSTYLTGGAVDDLGGYSLKLVSSSRSDFATFPLDCFAFDVENAVTGASKTATIEVISSGTLNNNDIRLLLEYMGTSGNPIASFGDTLASVLTAASALPSSSNTWNSPPSTPQKQLLQATFTPQRAGRVRGLVRLGKVSSTVWVNPQIAIN
jgi:hypothetical protein